MARTVQLQRVRMLADFISCNRDRGLSAKSVGVIYFIGCARPCRTICGPAGASSPAAPAPPRSYNGSQRRSTMLLSTPTPNRARMGRHHSLKSELLHIRLPLEVNVGLSGFKPPQPLRPTLPMHLRREFFSFSAAHSRMVPRPAAKPATLRKALGTISFLLNCGVARSPG
jgi:hypothetical protein